MIFFLYNGDIIDGELDDASPFLPLVPLPSDINENAISSQARAEHQRKIVLYDSCRLHPHLRDITPYLFATHLHGEPFLDTAYQRVSFCCASKC